MRIFLLFLPFALASQGAHADKTLITGKGANDTDTTLEDNARSFESLLEVNKRLDLKQLDTMISEMLENGTRGQDIWATISATPRFQKDQTVLVKEAIEKGYHYYLKFLLVADRFWWQNNGEYHWFLALSYGISWWDAHQPHLNWADNMDAVVKADNVAFVVAHRKIFDAALSDPKTVNGFLKHDSINLIKHYVKDLNIFAAQVHAMVTAGSIKLLHLLFSQNIPLDNEDILLDDACRDLGILRLLYENGYKVNPEKQVVDTFMTGGKLEHLELLYKISEENVPSENSVEKAVIAGHWEAVKWAISKSQKLIRSKYILDTIAKRGDLAMLVWVFEQDQEQAIPCGVVVGAASEGHVHILNWAYGIDPHILQRCKNDLGQVNRLVCRTKTAKTTGVQWLYEKNSIAQFGKSDLTIAVEKGRLDILKLAYKLDPNALKAAERRLYSVAASGYLEVLEWIFDQSGGLLPNTRGTNLAASQGHIAVLEWLASKNVHPDHKGLEYCVMWGGLKGLCWMLQKFPTMVPSTHSILTAAENGRLEIIKYIHKTNPQLLDDPTFQWADRNWKWEEITNFLIKIGKRPNPNDVADTEPQRESINEDSAIVYGTTTELNGKTRDITDSLKYDEGLELEQLDTVLGKELKQGTNADNLWTIMSSSAIFSCDQIPIIKKAVQKGYNNYLRCMLNPRKPWWQTEDRHWILALSNQAPWWEKEWWHEHQTHLNWAAHVDTVIKADNVAFVAAHREIFDAMLNGPAAIEKFIQHDSVNLTKHHVQDLNIFTDKVHAMVNAGSIKLLRFLVDQDISLDMDNLHRRDACRDLDILRLLHVSGYRFDPSDSMLDDSMADGKLASLELFYKISGGIPSGYAVEIAAEEGHFEAVKWALSKDKDLFPESRCLKRIVKRGDLAILKTLFEYDQSQYFSCIIMRGAASWGHVNVLNWIYKVNPNIIQQCNNKLHKVNKAVCENGKVTGAQWLHDRNSLGPFNGCDLSEAVRRGHLNVLKLAGEIDPNFLPTANDLNFAAGGGHLEILEWAHCLNDGLIPSTEGANQAAANGRVPALEWLALKDVFPNHVGLDNCVKSGKVQALRWMMQELPDLVPSPEAILEAAETGRLGVIEHLYKTRPDLLDYPKLLSAAGAKGWDRIVAFLHTNASNPNEYRNIA